MKLAEAENRATNSTNDPEGLFKALGLTPYAFKELTEDKIKAKVNAIFKIYAHKVHPDAGGSNDAMVAANMARDVFLDPKRRSDYLNRTGEFRQRR